jgi:hypothetical protein
MNSTPANLNIPHYRVDQEAFNGKPVVFSNLPHDNGTVRGKGRLSVRQYNGIGLVEIFTETEWNDPSHLRSYRFTLSETAAKQLKPDGEGGFLLNLTAHR